MIVLTAWESGFYQITRDWKKSFVPVTENGRGGVFVDTGNATNFTIDNNDGLLLPLDTASFGM
jgi:hypothetical protein